MNVNLININYTCVCGHVLFYRAMYEKGLQAFVSFIQSYAKHECNLIFRVKGIIIWI